MSTILTVLIMCAIGYLAFIFFAETTRLRFNPTSQRLRIRQSRGQWIGGVIALSSIAAFFVAGNLVDKLKPALLLAALAALVVAIIFNFTPVGIAEWFRNYKEKLLYGDLHNNRESGTSSLSNTVDETNQSTAQTAAPAGLASIDRNPEAESSSIQDHDINDSSLKTNHAEHPLANVALDQSAMQNNVVQDTDHVLVDQAIHEEVIDPDIAAVFPATGFVQSNHPLAANSGSFESEIRTDNDEIIVDDFFAEVDANDGVDPAFVTLPADIDEYEEQHYSQVESPVDSLVSTPDTAAATETVGEYVVEETRVFETEDSADAESIEDPGPHASEMDQLAFAMQSVNGDAIKLQQSVERMNELNEREQFHRTELHGARLAYQKAQEAQFEAHAHDMNQELELGVKNLHAERSHRVNLEHNLEDKRQALMQAELRVSELEGELKARQQVFHDQMESLAKTKEMARNAALLARRAATMQQQAHTTALKERAARERLEVSAKKAVNIARNAISKLAEEERKNSSTHGMH